MKIAFLFSGQGAQYVGMGKEIFSEYQEAKDIFDKANEALGFDLKELCFNGEAEELNKTENTQPAILTTSIAILKVLESKGITPSVVAGLSLGEYAAHVASGTIEFQDAVSLVKKRGRFMQEAVPQGLGSMAAIIGLSRELVVESCNEASKFGVCEVANYNCPGQIVIAGEVNAVEEGKKFALEKGAKRALSLVVSGPFHTSMLKPASDNLNVELNKIEFKDIKIPLITNVTGNYVNNKEDITELLTNQVMTSVRWEDSINTMINDGVDVFIEVGPGKVLSGFIKKIDRSAKVYNVEDLKSLEKTLEALVQ